MIECDKPTEHYHSGRALLLAWDTDMNKWLSNDETVEAVLAHLGYAQPPLTRNEMDFVVKCYMDYDGNINAMCPKSMEWWYWILIAIAIIIVLYMLGVRK